MRSADSLLITCEHGGNEVPREHAKLMRLDRVLLKTHRGYDPGALDLAWNMASSLAAPLHVSTTTRLLVDLNRSSGHPNLFGPSVQAADIATQRSIVACYYTPYRRAVERHVARLARTRSGCTHISVHSFTPVLRGQKRTTDIGFLYDPARPREHQLVSAWIAAFELLDITPPLRIRRNSPYKGTSDGLTTHLRTLHADPKYAGIELEVNQRLVRAGDKRWTTIQAALIASLALARILTRPG